MKWNWCGFNEIRMIKGKYLLKPIYEKEMLEILHAKKQGRPYQMGRLFKVKKCHDSTKYFLEQILPSVEEKNGHKDVGL